MKRTSETVLEAYFHKLAENKRPTTNELMGIPLHAQGNDKSQRECRHQRISPVECSPEETNQGLRAGQGKSIHRS